MTFYSFAFGLLFLFLGLLAFAGVNRLLYPWLRWRHERAKVTGQQGLDPSLLLAVAKLFGLIAMPVLGFYLGSMVGTGIAPA